MESRGIYEDRFSPECKGGRFLARKYGVTPDFRLITDCPAVKVFASLEKSYGLGIA
jgi:hypothetical protein